MMVNVPHKQRGIATVLIVLLLAMSLTVAVLTGVQYNRAAQEQSISLHSQTAAQALAWETAEIVRLYFDELRLSPNWLEDDGAMLSIFKQIEAGTKSSPNGFELVLNGVADAQAFVKKAWINPDGNPGFQVEIAAQSARDTRAESAARLEIVLIYNTTELELVPSRNVISFGGDTDLSGGINIHVEPGKTYDVAVDGNVTLGGISINDKQDSGGINSILSTRSIRFSGGSSTFFAKLHANCDISLKSSTSAELLYARNNICTRNTSSPAGSMNLEVKANGSAYLTGDVWGDLKALAGKGDHQSCPATAVRYCDDDGMVPNRPGVEFDQVTRVKDIATHGWVQSNGTNYLGNIKSDGGLGAGSNTSFEHAALGGEGCTGSSCESGEVVEAAGPMSQISPVPLVEIQPDTLDVNSLEPYANFIFFSSDGYTPLVTVRNVYGIEGGTYKLCASSSNSLSANHLCSLDGEAAWESDFPVINGDWSGDSGALKFENGMWRLKGNSHGQPGMVPGLAIFKGDLTLSGTFLNTFAATGSIHSTGDLRVYAPNYAGYDGLRAGTDGVFSYASGQGVCTQQQFPGLYPTTLCNTASGEYRFKAIAGYGNYGLLAGSCKPGTDCTGPDNYVGGDIDLGAKNTIYGAVKGGGSFKASGSTTVHGFISGLGIQQHSMGGGFTIDLTNLPEGYDAGGNNAGNDNGAGAVETETLIFWSRYL